MPLDVESTIKNINARIGWRMTRNLLGKECGITALGPGLFIERAVNQSSKDVSISSKIDKFWRHLIYSGDRLIKIYPLNPVEMSKVQSALLNHKADNSSFNQSFPVPISTSELAVADQNLHFAEASSFIYDSHNVISSALLSKAYYTEIIELDGSHLSDAGLELKANGGQIKCKQRQMTQCFHNVFLVPSAQILIMSLDLSSLPRSESSSQQVLLEAFIRKIAKIKLPKPINLFPAVSDLYEKPDGRISSITFLTGDGNGSTLKLKPGQSCLKGDKYHKGGVSAGSVLTKYKIAKTWDIPMSGNSLASIELTLPGKRVMLDDPKKHLHDATISNCPTVECLLFTVKRLMASLPPISFKSS